MEQTTFVTEVKAMIAKRDELQSQLRAVNESLRGLYDALVDAAGGYDSEAQQRRRLITDIIRESGRPLQAHEIRSDERLEGASPHHVNNDIGALLKAGQIVKAGNDGYDVS